jgi:hypothetical protein
MQARKEKMMPPGVNPTILYIGIIVLILAAGVGVYFKVIPIEVLITLISLLVGHTITIATQHITISQVNNNG